MTTWESIRPAEGEIKRLRLFLDESIQVWVQAENGLLLYYSLTQGRSRKRVLRKNPADGQSLTERIWISTLCGRRSGGRKSRCGYLGSSEWFHWVGRGLEGIILKDKGKEKRETA